MEPNPLASNCQLATLRLTSEGTAPTPPASLLRRIKLVVRRHLSPSAERKLKRTTNKLANRVCAWAGRPTRPLQAAASGAAYRCEAGDLVHVRSAGEIDATLDHWRQLRGCTFMPEMRQYCGTTQRVLKRMERFVDERDLRVKKARGIVLLEGVFCQGTADFGRCDRSCLFFWREEWLEKITTQQPGP